MTKYDELVKYSDPARVVRNARNYLGPNVPIFLSDKVQKKYMVLHNGKYVHFGEMGYQDYTRHLDKARRDRYLKRAMAIKGNWYQDPYSPNSLAINLLWM